jgi:hypothetical protein
MSEPTLPYDVFLSHSAKDNAVVRPLAERLRQEGLPAAPQPSTFNLQPSTSQRPAEPGTLVQSPCGST